MATAGGPLQNTIQGGPTTPATPASSGFHLTSGWWVSFGCAGGFLLAGTPAGPYVLGILSIALLYQISVAFGAPKGSASPLSTNVPLPSGTVQQATPPIGTGNAPLPSGTTPGTLV